MPSTSMMDVIEVRHSLSSLVTANSTTRYKKTIDMSIKSGITEASWAALTTQLNWTWSRIGVSQIEKSGRNDEN